MLEIYLRILLRGEKKEREMLGKAIENSCA